jgi:hypothetical protein
MKQNINQAEGTSMRLTNISLTQRILALTLALAALVSVRPAHAQPRWALDKGSVALGGTASYNVAGGEVQGFNKKSTASLTPYAYYFTSPNVAFGGELFLESSSRDQGESSTTMGIGPSALFTLADSTFAWYPFLQMSALLAWISQSSPYTSTGTTATGTGFGLELAGGGTYMLGPHVGVTALLYYQVQWISVDTVTETGNQYGLRLGLTGFLF